MKKLIYIIALGVISIFSSCEESADPLFFVNVERTFEIPGNLNTIETHFFELKNIPVLLEENLAVFNRTEDDIVAVNPADAQISSVFNDIDWTFIQRIEIYAVSRVDNSNKVRMYYSNEPDFGNRSQIGMFNSFVDVQEIFKEGLIDLEVRIKTRTFVPGNINAELNFSYGVFDEI